MNKNEKIIFDETNGKNRTVIKRTDESTFQFIQYRKIKGRWVEGAPPCARKELTLTQAMLQACDYFDWFPEFARILFVLNGKMKATELKEQSGTPHNKFTYQRKICENAGLIKANRDGKEIYYDITEAGRALRHQFILEAKKEGWLIFHLTEEEKNKLDEDDKTIFDKHIGANDRIVFRQKDAKTFEIVHYSKIKEKWNEGKHIFEFIPASNEGNNAF